MSELKELGAAIVMTLIVLLYFVNLEFWAPLIPKRFTVRHLLIVAMVLAILLGAVVALDAVIVRHAR
jgi:hypothetical protein